MHLLAVFFVSLCFAATLFTAAAGYIYSDDRLLSFSISAIGIDLAAAFFLL
jgi:hypothetical protein